MAKVKVKNNLSQMLPVITLDLATKRQQQSMLPAKGIREFEAEQISPALKSLARKGTVEIIES